MIAPLLSPLGGGPEHRNRQQPSVRGRAVDPSTRNQIGLGGGKRSAPNVEAIILVDDLVVAEGGVLALLNYELGAVSPRFEVMSLSELEDMLPVLGVRGTVLTIRQKWLTRKCDVPLRVYASKVQGKEQTRVAGARQFLEAEAREILGTLRIGDFDAKWP